MIKRLRDGARVQVTGSEAAEQVLRRFFNRIDAVARNREHFWVLGLNATCFTVYVELVSIGGTTQTIADPRQIFRRAIMEGVTSVIICHTHPSGSLTPSPADKALTRRLMALGKVLGIEVFDHLILTNKHYFSFADDGLMIELSENDFFTLEEDKLEKYRRTIEKDSIKRGRLEGRKEVARQMKARGYAAAEIAGVTGMAAMHVGRLKAACF